MEKITIWMENEYYCIRNQLEGNEEIHKGHASKLIHGLSDIFLPVMICDDEKAFLCKVKGLIPLSKYQERIIDKQCFIDLVVQMDMMIRIGEQHGFSINTLDFDYSRIFINPETCKLFFICWPIINPQIHNNIEHFFKEMAFQFIFNRNEDTTYVKEYIRFFQQKELFSLVNFEKMIMLLANDNEERNDNTSSFSFTSQENYGETTTLDPTFWTEWNLGKNTVVNDETSVLDPSLLNFNMPVSPPRKVEVKKDPPYLIRKNRGEKIIIGKSDFLIGIGQSSADYVVVGNKTVSRKHASIITRGTRYFLVDHNSTNGTFISGKQINSGREYEIHSGDVIKLSDEEFIFYC